ncbi:MAG TPA: bifunctional diaminohydroxyphosphoribosylaminopyrimidine deaminase/5-amino-6-(5-phosphoribosylamino)uracil reductase RibD [Blastocatellia bacterium]|nr:bifunctional diaminohydroxyphosphoribosylaminopyrimidine deaminase/5-amino-6-(5-phosphoribosylamino)uracil reductase RibD [Blastocatellia bacterium]
MSNETDKTFMRRALELAGQGAGLVSPNPMVGAVIVKDGRIIGEGFHRYDLLRHAEPNALEMAGELARGATLYSTLEPCCHHGRTPPCTDALIEAGLARVIIASPDPDQRVSGHGIQRLREAGMTVEVGLLEGEALKLNESYFKFVTRHIPFFHTVEYRPKHPGSTLKWRPSKEFINMAAQYDAIAPGDQFETAIILDACLSRFRHRPLIILKTKQLSATLPASKVVIIELNSQSSPMLEALAEARTTSVLALPGFHAEVKTLLGAADKLTLISHNAATAPVELDDVMISESEDFKEFTGYPTEPEKLD